MGLSLISAAVQQSATRWVDSHLWLLERSLPWINQADYVANDLSVISSQQLAAQLTVALKPYAGIIYITLHCVLKCNCNQLNLFKSNQNR
jgi:hypothetical protein